MIPKEELSLNNYVLYDGNVEQIYSLTEEYPFLKNDAYGVGVVTYDNIEGVPLTREWFQSHTDHEIINLAMGVSYADIDAPHDIKLRIYFDKKDNSQLYLNGYKSVFDVKYFHTLQNILIQVKAKMDINY